MSPDKLDDRADGRQTTLEEQLGIESEQLDALKKQQQDAMRIIQQQKMKQKQQFLSMHTTYNQPEINSDDEEEDFFQIPSPDNTMRGIYYLVLYDIYCVII